VFGAWARQEDPRRDRAGTPPASTLRDGGGEAGARGAWDGCGGTARARSQPAPAFRCRMWISAARGLRDGGGEAGAHGALGSSGGKGRNVQHSNADGLCLWLPKAYFTPRFGPNVIGDDETRIDVDRILGRVRRKLNGAASDHSRWRGQASGRQCKSRPILSGWLVPWMGRCSIRSTGYRRRAWSSALMAVLY